MFALLWCRRHGEKMPEKSRRVGRNDFFACMKKRRCLCGFGCLRGQNLLALSIRPLLQKKTSGGNLVCKISAARFV